jgi:hypothetical protein
MAEPIPNISLSQKLCRDQEVNGRAQTPVGAHVSGHPLSETLVVSPQLYKLASFSC